MGGDEAVDLAEKKVVLGAEKPDPREPRPHSGGGGPADSRWMPCRQALAGDAAESDEGDVVTGVAPHNLARRRRPVEPLHPPPWVLYHHRRRIRRLAVPHPPPGDQALLSPSLPLDLGLCVYGECRGGGGRKRANAVIWTAMGKQNRPVRAQQLAVTLTSSGGASAVGEGGGEGGRRRKRSRRGVLYWQRWRSLRQIPPRK